MAGRGGWVASRNADGGWLAQLIAAASDVMKGPALCCVADNDPAHFQSVNGERCGGFLEKDGVHMDEFVGFESDDVAVPMYRNANNDPARTQLLLLVQHDDAPGVLQYVADGAEPGVMGEALRLASQRGAISVVRELVAVGLSVNECCPSTGLGPLHLAATGGHSDVCEVLLDAAANVHQLIGGHTALALARKTGHMDVEEVISMHISSLVEQCEAGPSADNGGAASRRHYVLPRVSPGLSEAVLQALPHLPAPEGAALSLRGNEPETERSQGFQSPAEDQGGGDGRSRGGSGQSIHPSL